MISHQTFHRKIIIISVAISMIRKINKYFRVQIHKYFPYLQKDYCVIIEDKKDDTSPESQHIGPHNRTEWQNMPFSTDWQHCCNACVLENSSTNDWYCDDTNHDTFGDVVDFLAIFKSTCLLLAMLIYFLTIVHITIVDKERSFFVICNMKTIRLINSYSTPHIVKLFIFYGTC